MLKVNDEVIIVGGCKSCGCSGVVVDVTSQKVKVRFKEPPTNASNKEIWFRINSVKLLTETETKKEKSRKLYKIIDLENDIFYFNLTEEQANFLNSLYRKSIINDYEEISRLDIIEP